MIKPYSFLLYFLAIICCFLLGMSYAGIVDAGKGQGLAGGAIVLGYGVIGAGLGLLVSLMVANRASRKNIFHINIMLALIIAGLWAFFYLQYLEKQKVIEQEKLKTEVPAKPKTIPPD